MNQGTITLRRSHEVWTAEFTGPVGGMITGLFGTHVLPTAFTVATSAAMVRREIAAKWRGCFVEVAA